MSEDPCQKFVDAIKILENEYQILSKKLQTVTGPERDILQRELESLGQQIEGEKRALWECQHPPSPPPPPPPPPPSPKIEPARILSTNFANPLPPLNLADQTQVRRFVHDGADSGGTFPLSVDREWVQVLDKGEDLEKAIIGTSGFVIVEDSDGPNLVSDEDFPFSHPFGNDLEFFIVPDQPYIPLLGHTNRLPSPSATAADLKAAGIDDQYAAGMIRARELKLPGVPGVLGVEIDAPFVPQPVRSLIVDGARVAVFGRWIVDAGHDDFHTEIHPPLVTVLAQSASDKETHSMVVARPYLVGQEYMVGKNVDGTFVPHMCREILKVLSIFESLQIEAHPIIYYPSFTGSQNVSYSVRPPITRQAANDSLVVQYLFIVRTGVTVKLSREDDETVRVSIAMDSKLYSEGKPIQPKRHDRDYSIDELDRIMPTLHLGEWIRGGLTGVTFFVSVHLPPLLPNSLALDAALGRGIRSDRYDPPEAPSLDAMKATTVAIDQLPDSAHQGIVVPVQPRHLTVPVQPLITVNVVDDNQPFPVYGFLNVRWISSR